ncbi:sulfate ABC transporter substrate-binding protein [Opitutaceae bacterium EW11]|nr:sulfate ABC transporter substrate-binding protein [Opitutaceae bacterium EW11]
MKLLKSSSLALLVSLSATWLAPAVSQAASLLNVSYDVAREFYKDVNPAFAQDWKTRTGETVTIQQSHGGSSKQVRSVIDGLAADVVTMNQALDIDALANAGLIPADWSSRLPEHSAPTTSTILFIVRKGNPKGIKDWDDLVRSGVSVVIPNPKTAGNGRYSYLAAWGYALKKNGGDQGKAREFVQKLFANVPVLDTGGRGATTTFAQRAIGDVLLTFESEVTLMLREFGSDNLEVVVPSVSILAENPVVWVDKVVKRKGTEKLAKAYLEFLYTPAVQEIAVKHHLRPRDPALLAKHSDEFKPIPMFTIEEIAGSWSEAQKVHFSDGGLFDQIYERK